MTLEQGDQQAVTATPTERDADDPRPAVIRIRGLRKAFSGRTVLGPLDLDLYGREFIALLGPNGAGKSTLVKILDGVHGADAGVIEGPHGAALASDEVAVVHQDLGVLDDLTVFENLRLGARPARNRCGLLSRRNERRAAQAALDRFDLAIGLDTRAGQLSPGMKAMLAVARAAITRPRVIVLDETTSVLSATDASDMIARVKAGAPEHTSFVLITHKLEEALRLATRVVVLRDGHVVCDQPVPLPSIAEVTELLAPRRSHATVHRPAGQQPDFGQPRIVFDAVHGAGLDRLSFVVRAGEAVSITGGLGAPLPQIAYFARGLAHPSSGSVTIAAGSRVAVVPPVREVEGTLPALTCWENVTISSRHRWRTPVGTIAVGDERRDAASMLQRLNVQPPDPYADQWTLSGGNQQKVIFGRAILSEADVYVLCEPTRGVDVGTRAELYALMGELKRSGAALLILATDPGDALAVADRLLVLDDAGSVRADLEPSELTVNDLALLV